MEYFQYFFGMIMVLGKDDCLSNLLTIINFDTFRHQCI